MTLGIHIGMDLNIFSQKFVKACVGVTEPDWGFPEPKCLIVDIQALVHRVHLLSPGQISEDQCAVDLVSQFQCFSYASFTKIIYIFV